MTDFWFGAKKRINLDYTCSGNKFIKWGQELHFISRCSLAFEMLTSACVTFMIGEKSISSSTPHLHFLWVKHIVSVTHNHNLFVTTGNKRASIYRVFAIGEAKLKSLNIWLIPYHNSKGRNYHAHFYRWGNGTSERLSALLKVTKFFGSGARIGIQAELVRPPNWTHYHHSPPPLSTPDGITSLMCLKSVALPPHSFHYPNNTTTAS